MTLSQRIEVAMENAITHLASVLRAEIKEADTHRTLIVYGWNDDDVTLRAIVHYLVGLRACAIDAALNIRANLIEDTNEGKIDLFDDICSVVGKNNGELTDDQKQDERNPWIAESIWHMCMAVATRLPDLHLPGSIIALNYSHVAAKDHGLDLLAIYLSEDILGLSIIESKAYKTDPNKAINNAVSFFEEIDQDKHSTRIRQCVQIMRTALSPTRQAIITGSFWNRTRSYIPNPHYDASVSMNWANTRPSFRKLALEKSNIVIMPHIIRDFDDFFDKISDGMREFSRGI